MSATPLPSAEKAREPRSPLQEVPLRTALWLASQRRLSQWLLRPYLEREALVLMVGAEGTFKSFLALHWALTIAMSGELVIYLSAEGRGLWKRLRAWCMHHYPRQDWKETLESLLFLGLERPLNLSSSDTVATLTGAIELLTAGRRPALVVVDTMTRNSDGTIERSNEDALAYLTRLDQEIRAKYGASIILVHHIGHVARDRARGPFSLIASTDANFLLERPDVARPVVTVRAGRMKDCEPPPPFELEAHVVEIDELGEDGRPETSLILKATGNAPASLARPSGKNQKRLLAELERRVSEQGQPGSWSEGQLREIAKGLGIGRQSAVDAVHGLRALGYFGSAGGVSWLVHMPERQKAQKTSETSESDQGRASEKAESPLRTLLSDSPSSKDSDE